MSIRVFFWSILWFSSSFAFTFIEFGFLGFRRIGGGILETLAGLLVFIDSFLSLGEVFSLLVGFVGLNCAKMHC